MKMSIGKRISVVLSVLMIVLPCSMIISCIENGDIPGAVFSMGLAVGFAPNFIYDIKRLIE